jgi:hypothetical protein
MQESSNDFSPLFGIYDAGGHLLSSSTTSSTTATLTYFVPTTGFYYVNATSANDFATGFFALKISCFGSGCLEPLALSPAPFISVPYGGRATVSYDVSASEPLTVSWTEVSPDFGSLLTTGRSILTPPLFTTTSYLATATNPCGTSTSATITVTVQPPRGRPARHGR